MQIPLHQVFSWAQRQRTSGPFAFVSRRLQPDGFAPMCGTGARVHGYFEAAPNASFAATLGSGRFRGPSPLLVIWPPVIAALVMPWVCRSPEGARARVGGRLLGIIDAGGDRRRGKWLPSRKRGSGLIDCEPGGDLEACRGGTSRFRGCLHGAPPIRQTCHWTPPELFRDGASVQARLNQDRAGAPR
jgi:hypothetical protein